MLPQAEIGPDSAQQAIAEIVEEHMLVCLWTEILSAERRRCTIFQIEKHRTGFRASPSSAAPFPTPPPPSHNPNHRDPFQADNGDGFGVGGVSFLGDNDNNDGGGFVAGSGVGGGDRASSGSGATATMTMTPVSLEDRLCVDMKVGCTGWYSS